MKLQQIGRLCFGDQLNLASDDQMVGCGLVYIGYYIVVNVQCHGPTVYFLMYNGYCLVSNGYLVFSCGFPVQCLVATVLLMLSHVSCPVSSGQTQTWNLSRTHGHCPCKILPTWGKIGLLTYAICRKFFCLCNFEVFFVVFFIKNGVTQV